MTSGNIYIENRFNKAKFIENKRNGYGVNYIELSGLEDGQYSLWFKKEDVRIRITVHNG